MWSRTASRIILPMGECKVYSDLDLYLGVQAISWTEILITAHRLRCISVWPERQRHPYSQYGAMKVKDADCRDASCEKNLPRPNVDRESPDLH